MTEPELIRRERSVLHEFGRLAAERADDEAKVLEALRARHEAAATARTEATTRISEQADADSRSLQHEFELVKRRSKAKFESDFRAAQREEDTTRDKAAAEYENEKERAGRELQEARWEAAALLDAAKNVAQSNYKDLKNAIDTGMERCRSVEDETIRLLEQWRQNPEFPPATPIQLPQNTVEELQQLFNSNLAAAEQQLAELKRLTAPKAFQGTRLYWAFFIFWLLAAASLVWTTERPFTLTSYNLTLIAISVFGPIAISLAVRTVLAMTAAAQIARICTPMVQAIANCEAIGAKWLQAATFQLNGQLGDLRARHDQDMLGVERRTGAAIEQAKRQRDAVLKEVDQTYPTRFREITQRRDRELAEADSMFPGMIEQVQKKRDAALADEQARYDSALAQSQAQHETVWQELADRWAAAMHRVRSEIDAINADCAHLFPPWTAITSKETAGPQSVPPVLRCGEYTVVPEQIPHAVPSDARLRSAVPEPFTLPALLPFPAGCSSLFKATDTGRDRAIVALQAIMLRLLTSIPAGKVRFTIIDPVGLGENFAAFMHLADFDEALVNNRIWTEAQHIDQRLADLTEHMETVIQKFLRNEFETIEQYNAQAGEVAEPFRIVVVANFPANFSEASARRLVSIASSGARCGVYTLVSVDTRLPMPHGFNLADLAQHAVCFRWDQNRFVWEDKDFSSYLLTFDSPPPGNVFTDLLQLVGERAKEASRVEVPFEFIAPPPGKYWQADSRSGINVPLGRAGATKTQNMRLGQGTAQHALIAGKTGSGKSTLLHVLITNLSLLYSPDEIQLYLVDFKKGVEFKAYAAYELPHARVVAIESEREFGLSVLQRLDVELKRRGDLFRQAGVQDLSGYRHTNGSTTMPRIMLIVDEFQEFFVEDDKIAQEATLLLDRLVRQGRAFGIHVQLGSQTLGGAYSLARSTLGQMAVRIALQCSESDAHLILSDNNTAARLLSRPGEAIYNDANGLIEGNNFFQIVWLSDDRREEYLRRIRELAETRNYVPANPQIVFEGNVPSDIRKNHLLTAAVAAHSWPASVKAPMAWLGEAVAIKDPTAAVFRAQVGNNLLMVGQQDEAAMAIILSMMVSLAAQQPPAGEHGPAQSARFIVLDGSSADAAHAGAFDKLCNVLPHSIQIAGPRELPAVIGNIADAVDVRQKSPVADEPTIYLIIYDVQRFRDLRRQEDDFSFSRRSEEKPSPSKQFAAILREGPTCRIHTIVWCDSLNNFNRTFDRQMMREFDMRILFQMSASDSSTLVDSPIASKLGVNRAIYYSEEDSLSEKFRPYGLPTDNWLAWVRDQLGARPISSNPLATRSSP